MRVAVINCSAPHPNLGALKLAAWLGAQGHAVDCHAGDPGLFSYGYDLVCCSVIFSWHAPIACAIALRVQTNSEVWCGGPGMFALNHWWRAATGLPLHRGLDARCERQRGAFPMVFASRGCPVGCSFCLVPHIEGTTFTLDWEFVPAPILCDNNLSALPEAFQDHIVRRYQDTGTRLTDANSGFEPRTFDAATYQRWRGVLRGPWRLAFDEIGEADAVRRMLALLGGESSRRKRVYVLVGNEPIARCYERAMQVVAWGGEPYCQYFRPLNWLGDPATLRHRFDWTGQRGSDFCRYFNRYLWKAVRLADYTNRRHSPPPFASVAL